MADFDTGSPLPREVRPLPGVPRKLREFGPPGLLLAAGGLLVALGTVGVLLFLRPARTLAFFTERSVLEWMARSPRRIEPEEEKILQSTLEAAGARIREGDVDPATLAGLLDALEQLLRNRSQDPQDFARVRLYLERAAGEKPSRNGGAAAGDPRSWSPRMPAPAPGR